MAGLFKAFGAILDAVTTTAQVLNVTANAGLSLAQGAEAAAISYRDSQILQVMEDLGLSSGNPEQDLVAWKAMRAAEEAARDDDKKKAKAALVAK